MGCMRDPRHPAGVRATLSEVEPTGAVPPHAPPQTVKPDAAARVSAPGQAGVGGQPSSDMPTNRESQQPAADDIAADHDDVIAPATRDIYRRDWAEFAAWCRLNGADPAALPVSPVLV